MGPILATLAVAIGVPILLFYVYGVVPVSLCRSSGCGLSASASGVRLDFDEPEYSQTAANKSIVTDVDMVSHKEGNPSIGEMSLSLGSGTHLEHLGREQDGESASTVALAGSLLAHKLEVLADATQGIVGCSETASDRSDTATSSTRALHGSLLNYKTDALSTYSYKLSNNEGCSTSTADQRSEANLSLSSLEELTASLVQRVRSLKQQASEGSEDGVKYDDPLTTQLEIQPSATKAPSRGLLRNLFFNLPSSSSLSSPTVSTATSLPSIPTAPISRKVLVSVPVFDDVTQHKI